MAKAVKPFALGRTPFRRCDTTAGTGRLLGNWER